MAEELKEELDKEEIDINITPHRSLIRKLGLTGYKFAEAIAEFIDNSIDARIEKEFLEVKMLINPDFVIVQDNAKGMTESEARRCLTLAESEKEEDFKKLGKFGFGLKTASAFLGKKFTIITAKKDSEKQYRLEFDEEIFEKEGDWSKHKLIIEPKRKDLDHGTIIIIGKLKIKVYSQAVIRLKESLSHRFAPYLKSNDGKDVRIIINGEEIKPLELVFTGETKYIDFIVSGKKVHGWFNFLEKRSIKGFYGFNLFRHGRLIVPNAKIGFRGHPETAQLYGELHLDEFPTSWNKMEFIESSPEYEELIKKLEKIVKPYVSAHLAKIREERKKKKIERAFKERAKPLYSLFKNINIDNKEFRCEPHLIRLGSGSPLKEFANEKNKLLININLDHKLMQIVNEHEIDILVLLLIVDALAQNITEKENGSIKEFYNNKEKILSIIFEKRKKLLKGTSSEENK